MPTIQQMLNDVDLLYRNTFTTAQKIVWFNEEQRELFEIFEIDSSPYSFDLVADQYLYPIPSGVEIEKIKVMTIQINDATTPDFQEIPFKPNDNRELADESDTWYTIVEDNFYINVPNIIAGRSVYIYLDESTTDAVSTNLGVEPATPTKYQKLLKLRLLKRIAQARKDVIMANNYNAEVETMEADFLWQMKMNEPEFRQPIDTMPRPSRERSQQKVIFLDN